MAPRTHEQYIKITNRRAEQIKKVALKLFANEGYLFLQKSLTPECAYCIFCCRLAGWWLVSYVHRSARFRFYIIRGSVPLVSFPLLWLSFSLGKLPF